MESSQCLSNFAYSRSKSIKLLPPRDLQLIMNVLALFCLFLIAVALSVNGQFDDNEDLHEQEQEQQPQQTLTLTRESLEALLQMLSPTCRTEMEGAIGNNGEISPDCRRDIQEGLVALNIAPTQYGREQSRDGNTERNRREEKPRRAEPVASESNGKQAIFAIVGLIVLIFGSAAAYVVYYNSAHGGADAKKPKKLSKKKEEKLRMKAGVAQPM